MVSDPEVQRCESPAGGQNQRVARDLREPGSTVQLQGEVSDPDQNAVTVTWWQYNDAGTYPGDITFSDPQPLRRRFGCRTTPVGQTINVILEATDNGTPPLTRYQRVIVTVQ